MTLTLIAALLQATLTLLMATQMNPRLPASVKEDAIQFAEEAVSQATAALPSKTPAHLITIDDTTLGKSTGAISSKNYIDSQHGVSLQYPTSLKLNPTAASSSSATGMTSG